MITPMSIGVDIVDFGRVSFGSLFRFYKLTVANTSVQFIGIFVCLPHAMTKEL